MKNNNKKNNLWKTLGGNLLIWLLIIIMSITALQLFSTEYKTEIIDYTQFQDFIDDDIVESGIIIGRTFRGKLKEEVDIDVNSYSSSKLINNFTTVLPEVTEEMTKDWRSKGIKIRLEEKTPGIFDY